ncbi:MAG TPA: hydrogenase maturation nickel metallochaperone HypA [bacterium]|jgi:hydrogenase nickel incorporation protein HypA/HybF|nr:hydrogenase maturation nickel metallochaperone HypA [bacterium]
MHEMSLAVALLERVLAEAGKGGLRSVSQVTVELGSLQAIEPDLLSEAFRAAALNSVAEGARLDLQLRPAEASCRSCGQGFQPSYQDYVCPHCGQADVKILRGKEMFLLSLSGEAAEDAPPARAAAIG